MAQSTPTNTPDSTANDVTGQVDINPASIMERVDNMIDGAVKLLPNFAIALVVIGVFFLLGLLVRKIVRRTAGAQGRTDLGEVMGGFLRGAVTLFGVALALTILAPSLSIGSLVGSLGIGSVAIGFAFKDILQNWLAGLLILIRQPFEIGDQISVTGYEGTVKHIETRATIIRTYDGQRVVIPNSDVYTNAVTVKTAHESRRSQYDVGVGYDTDIATACDLARDVLSGIDGILSDPAPEALPWELAGSSINLRLRWWHDPQRSSEVATTAAVIGAIKSKFDEAEIDIPFPIRTVLFHNETDNRSEPQTPS